MKNSVHYKSPDCIGFAICEDDRNNFECKIGDAIVCPMCQVDICCATRDLRWGPNGKGVTTGVPSFDWD